ncbi:MAG TPA: hypothetical protein VLY83_01305 [Methanoregula sp.]|nr:hypothetical protein [Methanoregula sp.]
MTKQSLKPVLIGSGSNNVIRFTCPDCNTQNTITCRMPKDFFRETRDASCRQCRARYTIVSPGSNYRAVASPGIPAQN